MTFEITPEFKVQIAEDFLNTCSDFGQHCTQIGLGLTVIHELLEQDKNEHAKHGLSLAIDAFDELLNIFAKHFHAIAVTFGVLDENQMREDIMSHDMPEEEREHLLRILDSNKND